MEDQYPITTRKVKEAFLRERALRELRIYYTARVCAKVKDLEGFNNPLNRLDAHRSSFAPEYIEAQSRGEFTLVPMRITHMEIDFYSEKRNAPERKELMERILLEWEGWATR
jgi:hypothetical protein